MKARTVMYIDGWFTLIVGPLIIIFTKLVLEFLGMDVTEQSILLLRLFGVLVLMNGIFFIGSINTLDNRVRFSFIAGSMVVDGVSGGLLAWATYSGVLAQTGYLAAGVFGIIFILFILAFFRLSEIRSYHQPTDEEELIGIIKEANASGKQVRVRGSAHSVTKSIYTDNFKQGSTNNKGVDIYLNKYNRIIKVDRRKKEVTVQAGIHLGADPQDPAQQATWESSLLYQLREMGLALPDLGGITHQTVGGFSTTGSSGGSLKYSYDDAIVGLRIIDGQGRAHDTSPTKKADMFHAAGVSVGLLGVISTITFKCVDYFDIIGQESTTLTQDCAIDLFGDGDKQRPSLETFLRQTEYTRLMWWPQKGVDKMVVWQAKRMKKEDYTKTTNPPYGPPDSPFAPKPYEELGDNPFLAEFAAGLFYTIIGNLNRLSIIGRIINMFLGWILAKVLNLFVVEDSKQDPPGPQQFWDYSWRSLPMDNQIRDELLPTQFTELWIPIEKTKEVMIAMRDHYQKNGLSATGTFCCEIYGAKASKFWMSPAYERNVVRIDLFWFARNSGNPVKSYYPQFWELLKQFDFRFHWGKFISPPTSSTGLEYIKSQCPRWDAFMKLREKNDPNQIFVNSYWRRHFGIRKK